LKQKIGQQESEPYFQFRYASLKNGYSWRSCAKLAHLSGGVKVPVAASQAPRGIPSIELSAELPKEVNKEG